MNESNLTKTAILLANLTIGLSFLNLICAINMLNMCSLDDQDDLLGLSFLIGTDIILCFSCLSCGK